MIRSRIYRGILSLVILLLCSSHTERNILTVWVKTGDKLIVEHRPLELSKLKDMVKLWVLSPDNDEIYPEKRVKRVPYFGHAEISKTVVSIQCDRDATYGFYVAVQNEIEKAYNELREDLAQRKFGKSYRALSLRKQKAVNTIYPKRISEAEPNLVRNKDGELVKNNSWWY